MTQTVQPEMLSGHFKIGYITRDSSLASGTQAVTGVGFKPKAVIILANQNPSTEGSIGFDDAVNHQVLANYGALGASQWNLNGAAGESIQCIQGAGVIYGGHLSSLDADGFTISWTKTGSPTGTLTVAYLALG